MEEIIIFEPPKIENPEFRLYYDESGRVLFYTCEKPEGNYIVIDAITFAEARPDVRVVDGNILKSIANYVLVKFKPSNSGTMCEVDDINIISDRGVYWDLKLKRLD